MLLFVACAALLWALPSEGRTPTSSAATLANSRFNADTDSRWDVPDLPSPVSGSALATTASDSDASLLERERSEWPKRGEVCRPSDLADMCWKSDKECSKTSYAPGEAARSLMGTTALTSNGASTRPSVERTAGS
uniref:Secreted protein n=1 Tax=Chromera velia CCMP2878 TaxID=1169474 RepID=A0A0K6S6X4_9ALVE|eukprot:Cvel_464.t2-p1 / transcript=Cvel_464.t2 / gene=Cvel_464 / organism=Chromera_velia_CCMP2878 / gene_product=hypothetical protein / transcript_product=hypothetical protein / location=Cvel_scaffold14:229407-229808(+) / protein_length=134 / sequence_SO=supercontig / SO=protein_coding / is_pseudo=false